MMQALIGPITNLVGGVTKEREMATSKSDQEKLTLGGSEVWTELPAVLGKTITWY